MRSATSKTCWALCVAFLSVLASALLHAACGARTSPGPLPAPRDLASAPPQEAHVVMDVFTHNGFELSGAEYWPYVGSRDIQYPEEVLWGFYPQAGQIAAGETTPNLATATPAAVACATRAWLALRAFVQDPPAALQAVIAEGAAFGYTNKFYLWTNDYTHAANPFPPGPRAARMWYWKRRVSKVGRPNGFWKWEAVVDQRGQCHVPNRTEATQMIERTLSDLRTLETLPAVCRGGRVQLSPATAACAVTPPSSPGMSEARPPLGELRPLSTEGLTCVAQRNGTTLATLASDGMRAVSVDFVVKNTRALPVVLMVQVPVPQLAGAPATRSLEAGVQATAVGLDPEGEYHFRVDITAELQALALQQGRSAAVVIDDGVGVCRLPISPL